MIVGEAIPVLWILVALWILLGLILLVFYKCWPRQETQSAPAPQGPDPDTPPPFNIPDYEAAAFDRANWVFLRPSDDTRNAIDRGELPSHVTSVGSVLLQDTGHVIIATQRLSTRLDSQLSPRQAEDRLRAAGLRIVERLGFAPNLYEVETERGFDALDMSLELSQEPEFVYSEPVLVEYILGRYQPTDPLYGEQWQWFNQGADINVEAAWDTTRGAGTTIAVIDNGFDAAHEDLDPIDASGFFEEFEPGDVVPGPSDNPGYGARFRPIAEGMPDPPHVRGHGTFCAGIAAAVQDNGIGVSGVAPESDLLLVAGLSDEVGSQEVLAGAIAYVTTHGADIISCSLGPPSGDGWQLRSRLQDAIEFAVTKGRGGLGTPVFWAVSNLENPLWWDQVVSHPNIIAVGRSTAYDTEDGSAYGPELDFLAPGVGVYSTLSGNRYGIGTGTSFATPVAAGVGALVLSVNPNLSWRDVRGLIQHTCDKIGDIAYDSNGRNDFYGYGRVNAERSVSYAPAIVSTVPNEQVVHEPQHTEGTMSYGRAYLSYFFMWLMSRGDTAQQVNGLANETWQLLVRALFRGANVSIVIEDSCCVCHADPGVVEAEKVNRVSHFLSALEVAALANNQGRLRRQFRRFRDATGRELSITQKRLILAMFRDGVNVCLSMSGGAGEGWGDPGGGRGEPGGGRGFTYPG